MSGFLLAHALGSNILPFPPYVFDPAMFKKLRIFEPLKGVRLPGHSVPFGFAAGVVGCFVWLFMVRPLWYRWGLVLFA